jgi:hypothetical protein
MNGFLDLEGTGNAEELSLFSIPPSMGAIGRHAHVARFDYAVAVTISAPKFEGDLFKEIVTRYPVLQPIRLRTEAEIRVSI